MAMAGDICDSRYSETTGSASCCHQCPGDPAPDQNQDSPTDNDSDTPGDCRSCASCQGTSGGSGAKAQVNLPAIEKVLNALATNTVAVLWGLPPLEAREAPTPPGWVADPPFLKANREALRWHCALRI